MSTAVIEAPETTAAPAPKASPLEVVINRDVLLNEIAAAQAVSESKTTIPILSTLLLEAKGGKLYISATDLDQSLRTSTDATVKKEGIVAVPARKLYDYVKLLPKGDVGIKQTSNDWVQIRAGRSNTRMTGVSPKNFPAISAGDGLKWTRFGAGVLRGMISRVIYSISTEESRYTLNGALLKFSNGELTAVSTDGHRLTIVKKEIGAAEAGNQSYKVIIPHKALIRLNSLLGASDLEAVDFAEDDSTLYFRLGHRQFTSRKLTGQFPNYEAVIPLQNNQVLHLRPAELEAVIRRVATFADERSQAVKFTFGGNAVKIASSSSDSGESEESLETDYAGDEVVVSLNSSYVLDFMKATGPTGEVQIRLKDGSSSVLMQPEVGNTAADGFQMLYVVMPCRG